MFATLAAKLLPYRWMAAGLAFLALLGAFGIQTIRLADTEADLAEEIAAHAKTLQAYADRARSAVEKLAAQKAEHAAAQQEIVHAYAKERQARLASEARTAAADQRLREQIRAYAAGSCSGPGTDADTGRSEGDRAATLGLLLEDALGLSGALAEGAEQHAGEVRFLKRIIENDRAGCRPLDRE